jgi:hypothetical protein
MLRQGQRRARDHIVVSIASADEYVLASRLSTKVRRVLLAESGGADIGRRLFLARRANR